MARDEAHGLLRNVLVLLAALVLVLTSASCLAAQENGLLSPPATLLTGHERDPLAMAPSQIRFSWVDHAAGTDLHGVRQSAYRILASSSLHRLALDRGDLWDSGIVRSDRTLGIAYQGKPLKPSQNAYWKVEVWDQRGTPSGWSRMASWRTALSRAEWSAKWIAAATDSPEARAEGDTRPMPLFRASFQVRKDLAQAILSVTGMGQYEVHIDGEKVGHRELTPGWTDYRKTVLYDTYDVTNQLQQGRNAIGVMLGNGMYNVRKTQGRYTKFTGSFGQPKCLVQLNLQFADGSRRSISSGAGWKTHPGPITFSSTYGGEDFDARKAPEGWDRAGFDDSGWQPAVVVHGPGGQLHPEQIAPIRILHIYQPVGHRELRKGVTVYDFGQNFAGWPAIVVRGSAGSSVKLIPGELLKPDGSVTQHGSGGPMWFAYTLRGAGEEAWHPRFSYYGFRYVQVELQGPSSSPADLPTLVSIQGEAVHSSAEPTGAFVSSNPLLNRIHDLILAAMRNNIESILTDCPHREKLGWLEQTHLMGSPLNFDFDLERLYGKISRDMAEAQKSDGMEPEIAPQYVVFPQPFNHSPEWGSAIVLDPWIAFERYGDRTDLERAYPQMQRYLVWLTSQAKEHILSYGLGDWYDVGPGAPGVSKLTPLGVTATATYYQDIVTLQKTARALGHGQDEESYARLAEEVKQAFNAKFYHSSSHRYATDSQTANAMPLALGMVPEEDRAAVLSSLVADIRAHHNHTTAGDVGFPYEVKALIQGGRSDVLLAMMLRTDPPSYGYQLKRGATALTEAWDANPDDSQDHFMLGAGEQWFYQGLGGLNIDFSRDDARQIVLRPAFVAIRSSQVSYMSAKGPIASSWKRIGDRIRFQASIPANTSATIELPKGSSPANKTGVTLPEHHGDLDWYRVGSGSYRFLVPSIH